MDKLKTLGEKVTSAVKNIFDPKIRLSETDQLLYDVVKKVLSAPMTAKMQSNIGTWYVFNPGQSESIKLGATKITITVGSKIISKEIDQAFSQFLKEEICKVMSKEIDYIESYIATHQLESIKQVQSELSHENEA